MTCRSDEVLADVLDDAAKLIDATSLVKGVSVTYTTLGCPTGYCATGAVSTAATDARPRLKHAGHVVDLALDALAKVAVPGWKPGWEYSSAAVARWNDQDERTARQVTRAMRKTAKRLRAA